MLPGPCADVGEAARDGPGAEPAPPVTHSVEEDPPGVAGGGRPDVRNQASYKTKLCYRFDSPAGCVYAARCRFGELKL